ncbi:hypothetical protein BDA96_05G083800 [Sorghum bicolor]|uniref:DUF4220 domain-containing protein n=1 Tax=Sorghum bicolor TaxID=4558 RepID=A0A921QVP6_SORBI|nr:hypothetical protein BDA96_05G083800 [Sorghum bicolor]
MEDNNLWLRHLLNLVTQGSLALYVFWKSFYRISYSILVPAMFIFLSGIIKYGERISALKSASRDGLGNSVKFNSPQQNNDNNESMASYALETVLHARGLFVGRTVSQLGARIGEQFIYEFQRYQREDKLKIVMMELGMMFDLLYTKAHVLRSRIAVIFRHVVQILILVAFVLFQPSKHGAHNTVNIAISYTLFIGAILVEVFSIISKAAILQRRKMKLMSCSMGQLNFINFSFTAKSQPPVITKLISVCSLEKQYRKCFVKHIDASKGRIISSIFEFFSRQLVSLNIDRRLTHMLCLPFEHVIQRLHLCTDLHIRRHLGNAPTLDVIRLREECEQLSNYMMYLLAVYPSMLPVSAAAEDLEPEFLKWLRNRGEASKLDILGEVAAEWPDSPFEPEPEENEPFDLVQSLENVKEIWLRLLVYAAGKCHRELHARQLSKGGELITFVWLLMVHHGLGDVATEICLLPPNIVAERGLRAAESSWMLHGTEPLYAFTQQH